MMMKKRNSAYSLILIVAIACLVLFNKLGEIEIYALDEVKNATCAIEMMQANNFVIPTFNGKLRGDKPPLHYFFMIGAYKIFGVNEFAARFFSVIMGLLTLLITYYHSNKWLGSHAAVFTSVVLLASLFFCFEFHLAVPDPYLIFFMTVGFFSFYQHLKVPHLFTLSVFYIALGLAALAKGPVAIALPGLSILIFLFITKNFKWSVIVQFKPWIGLLIILAVTLPWYLSVHIQTHGEWTELFFFKHNLNRFANEMEGHGGLFLITFGYVLAGMLPFSLFLVQAFWHIIKDQSNHFLLFAAIVSVTIIVFFSISSTKLPNYTMPAYPFLAVLLGNYFSNFYNTSKSWSASIWIFMLLCIAFPFIVFWGLKVEKSLASYQYLAFYFSYMPLVGILVVILYYKKQFHAVFATIAAGFVLLNLLFFGILLPTLDDENPVKKSASILKNEMQVVACGLFNPAYVFYLQRKIPVYANASELQKIPGREDVFIILREHNLEKFNVNDLENIQILFKGKDLFEKPVSTIVKWERPRGDE
jgi:hypothetical protein